MVCWLSSFCFVVFRNFLYKGMLLPSFITETLRYILNLQLSPYAFKIFLFFIIFYLRAMGSFPWQVFLLLVFLFCSTVFLAIKLHQHLSFQRSHFKSLYIIAASRVFFNHKALPASVLVLKPCQHSTLSWSNVNTSFVPTLIFVIKLPRHFICIEATSTLHPCRNRDNIHLCHEITLTLHSPKPWQHSWSHVKTSFAQKSCQRSFLSCQHFIRAEAMPTLHFTIEVTSTLHSSKPWQHSWNHIETSFV